jgi:hypothetical protein
MPEAGGERALGRPFVSNSTALGVERSAIIIQNSAVRAFGENPVVKKALNAKSKPSTAQRVRAAGGAPGRLLTGETDARATINARKIVDAATSTRPSQVYSTALAQGSAGARGAFANTLEALVELLGERARDALHKNDAAAAASAARAVDAVLKAQTYAEGNVSPQLIASKLIRDLGATLR